jgi:hypothetical protein
MLIRTRTLFVLLSLCVVSSSQTLTPGSGRVKNGVYRNDFFSFTYAYPTDWVVHGKATQERIMELGKEKAKESNALSTAAANVLDKNTYNLLTVFQYAVGTPGLTDNPTVQVVAEDVRHAPAITDGKIYLLNVRELMTKMGGEFTETEPVEIAVSGHHFFRQDGEMKVNGRPVFQTMIVTVAKGYALAFIFASGHRESVETMIKTIDSLKFIIPPRRSKRS